MNKRGFTLIELLAVIVVLGIVLVIAIPSINNIIENSRLDVFKENENKLKQSAIDYFSNHFSELPKNINDSVFMTLTELKDEHLITDIYDPKDNSVCDITESGVTVTKTGTYTYSYDPYLKCTNYNSDTIHTISNIAHTYDAGTGKYTITVDVNLDVELLTSLVTGSYSVGFIAPTLMDYTTWNVGTSGSQGQFLINGLTTENQIILHTNPWGVNDVVWASLTNDATSDPDGGFGYYNIPIDNTKTYRLTVWMRREDVGDGRTYFGTQSNTVANLSDGSTNNNPYFINHLVSGIPQIENNWLLYVAYIHPYNYALTTSDPTNGVYDGTTKARLVGATDFKWTSTAKAGGHRAFLYYSTTTTEKQYWIRRRFELVDCNEPSIDNLLDGDENINVNDYTDVSSTNQAIFIVDNPGTYNFILTKRSGKTYQFTYTIPQ